MEIVNVMSTHRRVRQLFLRLWRLLARSARQRWAMPLRVNSLLLPPALVCAPRAGFSMTPTQIGAGGGAAIAMTYLLLIVARVPRTLNSLATHISIRLRRFFSSTILLPLPQR